MATQWYWLHCETVNGPVSFKELVELVRDHHVDEDTLVRPDYCKEWQKAETVVGLFYMSRRVPEPSTDAPRIEEPVLVCSLEIESGISESDFSTMMAVAEEIEATDPEAIQMGQLSPTGLTNSCPPLPNPWMNRIWSLRPTEKVGNVKTRTHAFRATTLWLSRHKLTCLFALAALVACGNWSVYALSRSSDVHRYSELRDVLRRIEEQRARENPDFGPLRQQIQRIAHDYPSELVREGAGRRNPVKHQLLFIVRDTLPAMLKTDLKTKSISEQHLSVQLTTVGKAIGI